MQKYLFSEISTEIQAYIKSKGELTIGTTLHLLIGDIYIDKL
jgi:hypothetical protein